MKKHLKLLPIIFIALFGCAKKPPKLATIAISPISIQLPTAPTDKNIVASIKLNDAAKLWSRLSQLTWVQPWKEKLLSTFILPADFIAGQNAGVFIWNPNAALSVAPPAVTPPIAPSSIPMGQIPPAVTTVFPDWVNSAVALVLPVIPETETAKSLAKMPGILTVLKNAMVFQTLQVPALIAPQQSELAKLVAEPFTGDVQVYLAVTELKKIFDKEVDRSTGMMRPLLAGYSNALKMFTTMFFDIKYDTQGLTFIDKFQMSDVISLQAATETVNLGQFLPNAIFRGQVSLKNVDFKKYFQNLPVTLPGTEEVVKAFATLAVGIQDVLGTGNIVSAISFDIGNLDSASSKLDSINELMTFTGITKTQNAEKLVKSLPEMAQKMITDLSRQAEKNGVVMKLVVNEKGRKLDGWPVDIYTLTINKPGKESSGSKPLTLEMQLMRAGDYLLFANGEKALDELEKSFINNKPNRDLVSMKTLPAGGYAYLDLDVGQLQSKLAVLGMFKRISTPVIARASAEGTITSASYINGDKRQDQVFVPSALINAISQFLKK